VSNDLYKKWQPVLKSHEETIETSIVRALESASHIGIGIISIKKDRRGGYIFRNKLWHEVDNLEKLFLKDEFRKLGASGPFGGDPSDHPGE
jgi:hypothetical protein